MANNRKCPNGHEYDADIYGDKCPFCPPSGAYGSGSKTQVIGGGYGSGNTIPAGNNYGGSYDSGKTQVASAPAHDMGGKTQISGGGANFGRTRISPVGSDPKESVPSYTRRVVGVLVTYDHNPAGDLHRINEGLNSVGHAASNTIPVTRDSEMSSEHFTIVFRPVDNAYFIRDEKSVNGTFINGELLTLNTSRLLNNYDVIKAGKTTFIFLAIPKLD